MSDEEQKQRAKWDLLLADLEARREQLRLTRPEDQESRFKPWQVAFVGMTAGAALFGVGAVIGGLIVHLARG
jgi:hypothetical protein